MNDVVYHRWRGLVGEWRWKYEAPFYYMLGAFYAGSRVRLGWLWRLYSEVEGI